MLGPPAHYLGNALAISVVASPSGRVFSSNDSGRSPFPKPISRSDDERPPYSSFCLPFSALRTSGSSATFIILPHFARSSKPVLSSPPQCASALDHLSTPPLHAFYPTSRVRVSCSRQLWCNLCAVWVDFGRSRVNGGDVGNGRRRSPRHGAIDTRSYSAL